MGIRNNILVLDGMYLGYQAQFATADMREVSVEGHSHGAEIIYSILGRMLYLSRWFSTNRLVFCWDSQYSLRREIFPGYKQSRLTARRTPQEEADRAETKRQLAVLRNEILPEIGFYNNFLFRGYEADDIIARVCSSVLDEQIVIVSADTDLYQLLDMGTCMHNPTKRETMTAEKFQSTYGISPTHWIDVKSIAGCPTDDIPGVGGVGPDGAIKYLLGQLKPESHKLKQINSEAGKAIRARNTQLVMLPFQGTPPTVLCKDDLDPDRFFRICQDLGFKSFLTDERRVEWTAFFSGVFDSRAEAGMRRVRRAADPDQVADRAFI